MKRKKTTTQNATHCGTMEGIGGGGAVTTNELPLGGCVADTSINSNKDARLKVGRDKEGSELVLLLLTAFI